MKKFNVNISGNFNIYGEIIPINAFYGKIDNTLYYYCKTSKKDILKFKEVYPMVDGVLPLPVYIWQGGAVGFVLKLDYGKIAKTIYDQATKRNAWNNGVKRDICYGMGKTIAEKTNFMTNVDRKYKTKSIKAGSKYHAERRNINKGQKRMEHGEQILQYKQEPPKRELTYSHKLTIKF